MTCCCDQERIIIVHGDDTTFNGNHLCTFIITSSILEVSDYKAQVELCGIVKEFDDLSTGQFVYDLNAEETSSLPYGNIFGTLRLISLSDETKTFTSIIPFKVIATVYGTIEHQNAQFSLNVTDGKNVAFKARIECGVSVEVGEVVTLQPDQSAYVENVGTSGSAVFNFGIPKGDTGAIQGQEQANWTETDTSDVSYIKNKPTLATVATSGSYSDLSNKPTIPSKTSDLNNDSGFITSSALSGYATETWVGQQGYITGITSLMVTTALGFTPYNSSNPNGYQENVIESIKVNGSALTPTNKAVDITVPSAQIQSNWTQTNSSSVDYIKNKPTLATVATSGSYNDLSNKPTIPTVEQTYDGTSTNAQSGVAIAGALSFYVLSANLATVATSGSYTDLSNKPTGMLINVGTAEYSVAVLSGYANQKYSTSYGYGAEATGVSSLAIGGGGPKPGVAMATGKGAIAIGSAIQQGSEGISPRAVADYCIQIGCGYNNEQKTMKVMLGENPSENYTLLESDGTIPMGRLKSGVQTTTNLVTSVSSSSTDSQYASAKCLYDLCGNVTALINAL